jgi:hypothetical protein
MTEHTKVRFQFETSEGHLDTESIWAIIRQDDYEIDNIPFFAKEVALGDLIAAEADKDGLLWFTKVIRPSRHSTIRLWFEHVDDVAETRELLRVMGCASEVSDLPRLVAVDVPHGVPYERVRAFLEDGEAAGKFEYQEACLGVLP